MHIITSIGYSKTYPDVFGERHASKLAKAIDVARGGYFRSVSRQYPAGAWYSYDDRTCDYGSQVTEYVYWALTSLLDGQDFRNRDLDISYEWKLNTPEKLRAKDKAVFKILTDPKYKLPTRLPDGKYQQARKLSSVKLNASPGTDSLKLTAKFPLYTIVRLEKSHDLQQWIVAQNIDDHDGTVSLPMDPRASQAQFFRLCFSE
mgnify:CR=1 FL=1